MPIFICPNGQSYAMTVQTYHKVCSKMLLDHVDFSVRFLTKEEEHEFNVPLDEYGYRIVIK